MNRGKRTVEFRRLLKILYSAGVGRELWSEGEKNGEIFFRRKKKSESERLCERASSTHVSVFLLIYQHELTVLKLFSNISHLAATAKIEKVYFSRILRCYIRIFLFVYLCEHLLS